MYLLNESLAHLPKACTVLSLAILKILSGLILVQVAIQSSLTEKMITWPPLGLIISFLQVILHSLLGMLGVRTLWTISQITYPNHFLLLQLLLPLCHLSQHTRSTSNSAPSQFSVTVDWSKASPKIISAYCDHINSDNIPSIPCQLFSCCDPACKAHFSMIDDLCLQLLASVHRECCCCNSSQ